MPISTIATGNRQPVLRLRGFSLLEILVVVFIIGLVAAVAAPSFIRDNPSRDRDDAAEAIARMLTLASDYAMFRGQLMAVRLSPNGLEPLVFDLEDYEFETPPETAFAAIELDESLLLEWTIDEQQDATAPDIASAIEKLQKSEVKEFGAEKEVPPQLFIFPSGETTPVTLKVLHSDVPGETIVEFDTIGRARLPHLESDDEEPAS